jgi:hypothetical protein
VKLLSSQLHLNRLPKVSSTQISCLRFASFRDDQTKKKSIKPIQKKTNSKKNFKSKKKQTTNNKNNKKKKNFKKERSKQISLT